MNKILIAGALMFLGGFLLADTANLNLVASINGATASAERKTARSSVTPFPGANTADACKVAFKDAEEVYKLAVKTAKEKRDMAVRAKNLCMQKINEARKSPTPTPTSTVR